MRRSNRKKLYQRIVPRIIGLWTARGQNALSDKTLLFQVAAVRAVSARKSRSSAMRLVTRAIPLR
jgi:hypothetical protein